MATSTTPRRHPHPLRRIPDREPQILDELADHPLPRLPEPILLHDAPPRRPERAQGVARLGLQLNLLP